MEFSLFLFSSLFLLILCRSSKEYILLVWYFFVLENCNFGSLKRVQDPYLNFFSILHRPYPLCIEGDSKIPLDQSYEDLNSFFEFLLVFHIKPESAYFMNLEQPSTFFPGTF